MGKSHLIALIAFVLLFERPEANIYLAYSHKDLMEKDHHLLSALKELSGKGRRLKTILPDAKTKITTKDFVLIDECDEVYFSNPKWFGKAFLLPRVIAFTATMPGQEHEHETELLAKFFDENIFDSQLKLKLRDG